MKSQANDVAAPASAVEDVDRDTLEAVPMELLSHVAGGLPYNVPGYAALTVESPLPYNVG